MLLLWANHLVIVEGESFVIGTSHSALRAAQRQQREREKRDTIYRERESAGKERGEQSVFKKNYLITKSF